MTTFILREDQKPSNKTISRLSGLKDTDITYDEDCPEMTQKMEEALKASLNEKPKVVTEEKISRYVRKVHDEMLRRGISEDDIPKVIGKTGFLKALSEYPEEQLCYDVSDAVDEILLIAAKTGSGDE